MFIVQVLVPDCIGVCHGFDTVCHYIRTPMIGVRPPFQLSLTAATDQL